MDEFTALEVSLMEKMIPQHKALMSRLSPAERNSLAENVNLDNIDLIQSWIKSGEEIEEILFWDKGGKYNDPEWINLKPVDETTKLLHEQTKKHYEQLKAEAVEVQIRSDLALYSQFNTGLIFTGLAGAERCNIKNEVDDQGEYFKGVELRCIGSVEDRINSITIFPLATGEFKVHYGTRINNKPQGICVCTGDSFSLIQLANLADKDLPKLGYDTEIRDLTGKTTSIDPKAIRRAAHKGVTLGYEEELLLFASAREKRIENAIETADILSRCFYNRFGLETECCKIGNKYGNFFIMRDDNFDRFLPNTPVHNRGLVLLTATLVCRRCRRELEGFRDFAKWYPEVTFVLVNLASPQSKFYERVFADMGGGDSKRFRDHAVGSTPFVIIYTPDKNGVLQFAEYYGTEKAEAPPSTQHCIGFFDKYFQ
jgi:hypothetical protein